MINWRDVVSTGIIILFVFYMFKNWVNRFITYIKKKNKIDRTVPYINQPLNSKDNDQIGVSVYVEKIQQAITAGAEIIAIASDFGTGKSSLISLLEKEYGIFAKFRYKFSTINLWGFVKQEDDATEIHRNFIYQLVSHLNPKRGSHLSKRMSKNFGVLRLGLGSSLMMFFSFTALLLLFLAEAIRRYPEKVTEYIQNFIPEIAEVHVLNGSVFCYFLFVIILFYIITRTDIVFSSPKSEGNREIDENIVMDYYKMQVLNKGILKHYVVVIEDLDRISNPQVIFDFLIELHKYYIPEYDNRFWKWLKNKVTFIVCIKTAAQLQNELAEWMEKNKSDENNIVNELNMQEVYSKIFDLIIELPRINIDNYDAVLNGLLEEKKGYLVNKELIKNNADVSSIEGIQWIIRGEKLSIREIKQRLNDAFILYEVLVDKFGNNNIKFNKCIIVAYLTNAFSADMLKIMDNTFDECINSYIKNEKDYASILEGCSEKFIETIKLLVEGKQIQSDYRVYFYNYPKKSYLYNTFELKVINTLLYNSTPESDFSLALEMTDSEKILYAINKIHDLKINLPKVALKYEKIVNVVLKEYPRMIVEYIRDVLNYSENEIARTTSEIKDIIYILLYSSYKSEDVIDDIISIWKNDIPKKSLLEIRQMLCKEYRKDIVLFGDLFTQDNPLITINEVKLIADNDEVASLFINYEASSYDDIYFKKLCEIFSKETLQSEKIQIFYNKSYEIINKSIVVDEVFSALDKEATIPDLIDNLLFDAVSNRVCNEKKYIELLEKKELARSSIDNIHKLQWSEGLSEKLCNVLFERKYYVDYIVNAAVEHVEIIDLNNQDIAFTIEASASEIQERNVISFTNIRMAILQKKLEKKYKFIFLEPYQGLTEKELYIIEDVDREIELMSINKPAVTLEVLIDYFNTKYHDARKSAKIIDFIHDMCDTSQKFSAVFYKLDMDNIRFRKISKENRVRILEYIKKCGMLNTITQKLEFMQFTKKLSPELEKEITSELTSRKEYEDEYAKIIYHIDEPSQQTIKNIKVFKYMHIYGNNVNETLYNEKMYKYYLFSTTMRQNYFVMPVDQEALLAAENIFKDNKWDNMINLMSRNEKFMNTMAEKEIYKVAPLTRERFTVVSQNSDMLIDLFSSCNDKEAISYLCKIKGFKDYKAAKKYVVLLEQRSNILVDQNVYDHTHHMLIDSQLKRRYTKARNAILK